MPDWLVATLLGWAVGGTLVAVCLSYWFRYQRGDFDKRP